MTFGKWRTYSWTARKEESHRLRGLLFLFLIFFLVFFLFHAFAVSSWALENGTMRPGFEKGDRIVFSSRAIRKFLPNPASDLGRGQVVLVDLGLLDRQSFPVKFLDAVLRFFTAQRLGLGNRNGDFYVRRIVGLPGDEVTVNNFVVRVKSPDSAWSLTEFELWEKPYDVDIPQMPALWDESLPFSGSMDTIVLGEDECFVLSDSRGSTNDSRTWGPLPLDLIAGKALFRYWPLSRLGPP